MQWEASADGGVPEVKYVLESTCQKQRTVQSLGTTHEMIGFTRSPKMESDANNAAIEREYESVGHVRIFIIKGSKITTYLHAAP